MFSDSQKTLGNTVFKINLNSGDKFFFRSGKSDDFNRPISEWYSYLEKYILLNNISSIYVFGDCRSYHQIAKQVADYLNISFYVFELGYIRPDYVTLEKAGVNDYSALPRNIDFYLDKNYPEQPLPLPANPSYFKMARSASIYYFINSLPSSTFKYYRHHKNASYIKEAILNIKNAYRKIYFKFSQSAIIKKIESNNIGSYFVVPLQVSTDFQIKSHSDFSSVANFIKTVLVSFASSTTSDSLVFKHHPVDRGHANYQGLISMIAKELSCHERVYYVHDTHLPTLLKNAKGSIVINSTVGISSLWHNTPLIVLGRANYNFKGLTFQGSLDDFWLSPGIVDYDAFMAYYNYVIAHTQFNGSFYGLFPNFDKHTNLND
jgi:capsule polysaccharide modification protein KpsS